MEREIWKVVDPRSAALIDVDGEVKAYSPSTQSQRFFDFTTQRKGPWNLFRFTSTDWDVEQVREAMAKAMFTKEPQVVDVDTSRGTKLISMLQYIPDHHLWLSTAYPSVNNKALTGRQVEILKLLANDLSLKEVATSLGITESAVQSHLQTARKRIGVKTTHGLVAWAVSNGYASSQH